jgi:isopenicillin-N epimerase
VNTDRTFGHAVRDLWPLEPGAIYLNHGTLGVTPRPVLAAQAALNEEIEAHPARFMFHELKPRLRAAADRAARIFGGRGQDYVFTDNATAGVNAVLRSIDLGPGDELLITNQTYGAVQNAARYACRRSGADLTTVDLPFPIVGADDVVAALDAALNTRTRLVILDHITSDTALVLPLDRLIARCHAAGARVLVDGAHAPGQIAVDIPALNADWYVGNLHKWYFAPRGCGLLWASEREQASLHPAVISWRLDEGFDAEFDWTGTRNPTPFLCFPNAADVMDDLDAHAVRHYNNSLVRAAADLFAQRFGGPTAPAEMTGAMTLAPLPERLPATHDAARDLRGRLLDQHDIEVSIVAWQGRLWARLAAQIYCEMEDFVRAADAIDAISKS